MTQDLTQLLTIHTDIWRCKLIKRFKSLEEGKLAGLDY